MDKIAFELLNVARELTGRDRVAYGFSYDANKDWDALVGWLQSKFRKQRFRVEDRQIGDAIWEKSLWAGSNRFIVYKLSGRPGGYSGERTEMLIYGDGGYDQSNNLSTKGYPSAAAMKKAVVKVLNASPVLLSQFTAKGMTPKQEERVGEAIEQAAKTVKDLIADGLLAATPKGRGMEYDEPSGYASYIPGNQVEISQAEELEWEQTGNKGVLSVLVSER